jgi:hypothetical protein
MLLGNPSYGKSSGMCCWNDICKRQGKPRGLVPGGKAASMFEVTLITESANHKCYRVSLRSSSKRVPSNPSSNGVEWVSKQARSGESPGGVLVISPI